MPMTDSLHGRAVISILFTVQGLPTYIRTCQSCQDKKEDAEKVFGSPPAMDTLPPALDPG